MVEDLADLSASRGGGEGELRLQLFEEEFGRVSRWSGVRDRGRYELRGGDLREERGDLLRSTLRSLSYGDLDRLLLTNEPILGRLSNKSNLSSLLGGDLARRSSSLLGEYLRGGVLARGGDLALDDRQLSRGGERSRRGGVLDLWRGERSREPGCQLSLAGGDLGLSLLVLYVSALGGERALPPGDRAIGL